MVRQLFLGPFICQVERTNGRIMIQHLVIVVAVGKKGEKKNQIGRKFQLGQLNQAE